MTASDQKNSKLLVRGFGLSHVGALRKRNEDAVYIAPGGHFAILADGMGGHLGGQEASGMAIRLMRDQIEEYHAVAPSDRQPLDDFLRQAFAETSAQIHAEGKRNPALANMGSTLICLVVAEENIFIAHSGDSRGYFIRNSQIFQVTPDHTLENEQILAGKPRSEVELMTIKHVLSRNVGMFPVAPPDVVKFPAISGDVWLLCSDGLSNKLKPAEILWHIQQGRGNLPKSAKGLIEHAFHAGGEDNISVCLVGIDKEDRKKPPVHELGLTKANSMNLKTQGSASEKQK